MSRIMYDGYERIVTVPCADQSKTNLILKQFLQTCACPPGFSQETCFANMNKQSGDPVLENMPTGAVFSIADDSEQCVLEQRRACAPTFQIARPFEPRFMNRDLTFTLGTTPPQGFNATTDFRGQARWFDGDDYRAGSFWKSGPRAGLQTNVNAQGTQRLPWPIPASDSGFPVDMVKVFDYGGDIRYPQAYTLARAIN